MAEYKRRTGVVGTDIIETGAVKTGEIFDGTIIAEDIATDAIETDKIKDLNVTTGKLAAGAVEDAKLASSTDARIKEFEGLNPVYAGRVTLSTGGGIEVIVTTGVRVGDIAVASILSDDTGTVITSLELVIAADQVTCTRTDDGTSNDDAVINLVVFRNGSPAIILAATETLSTGGGAHTVTASGVANVVGTDIAICSLVSQDTGTPINVNSLLISAGAGSLTITNSDDDGTTADDAVASFIVLRPSKKTAKLIDSGSFIAATGGGTTAVTVAAKKRDTAIVTMMKDDTGTAVTTWLDNVSADNTLTHVQSDDGSSSDNGIWAYQILRSNPIHLETGTLPATGVLAITDNSVSANDVCLATLETDDSGTAVTAMIIAATDLTITCTRNDDGTSADDGTVNILCFRATA